jgi:hypothetical protein
VAKLSEEANGREDGVEGLGDGGGGGGGSGGGGGGFEDGAESLGGTGDA